MWGSEICVLTSPVGDSDTHSSLRRTDSELSSKEAKGIGSKQNSVDRILLVHTSLMIDQRRDMVMRCQYYSTSFFFGSAGTICMTPKSLTAADLQRQWHGATTRRGKKAVELPVEREPGEGVRRLGDVAQQQDGESVSGSSEGSGCFSDPRIYLICGTRCWI